MRCFLLVVCLPAFVLMFDCSDKPDGIYEPGCKAFLKCINGTTHEIECHDDQVFNSNTNECDDPQNVPAPCGEMIDCSLKPDGHYPDLNQGCHSYFTCNGGSFFGHNFCPAGLVFNEDIGVCDWSNNVYEPCGLLPRPPPPVTTPESNTQQTLT